MTAQATPDIQTDPAVAVIAVHGVGDPLTGQTSARMADLLLSGDAADRDVMAGGFEASEIRIPVHTDWPAGEPSKTDDPSVAHSREALGGLQEAPAMPPYRTFRRSGTLQANGDRPRPVHLYELSWADLSRAPGLLAQVVLNLYQLAFHLAVLGRKAVGLADAEASPAASPDAPARDDRSQDTDKATSAKLIDVSDRLHRLSQWLLPTNIPVLNLFTLAAILPLLGLYLPTGMDGAVGAAILGFGVLAATTYLGIRRVRHGPLGSVIIALVYGLAMLFLSTEARLAFIGGVILLAATGLAVWASMAIVRSRPKRLQQSVDIIVVLVAFLWSYGLWSAYDAQGGDDPYALILLASALVVHGLFLLLQVAWTLLWWVLMGVWLAWAMLRLTGTPAAHRSARALYTGALGLTLSATVFFMLTIVLWAALLEQFSVTLTARELTFEVPFPLLYWSVTDVSGAMPLEIYAQSLFRLTTGDGANGFLLALVVCGLLAAAAMLPSAWYESRPGDLRHRTDPNATRRLGAWLDDGFFALAVAAGVLVAAFVWLGLGYQPWLANLTWLQGVLVGQELVKGLGATLAGAIPLVLFFRTRLPRTARNAVDILLDVDSWLRQIPGDVSPRGRILARYLSLLQAVAARDDCRTIVIIAHSQGTVITADLLRLLKKNSELADQVFGERRPRIRLVTAGSPLRQLYARRFPHEYAWVEGDAGSGPDLADFPGVERWLNLYNSGDYVGRALWANGPEEPWDPRISPLGPNEPTRDLLLGLGAHTHYFDGDDPRVFQAIRYQVLADD